MTPERPRALLVEADRGLRTTMCHALEDGGFTVVEVPSREVALEWAAKIAAACRCAQQVFELLPDDAYRD